MLENLVESLKLIEDYRKVLLKITYNEQMVNVISIFKLLILFFKNIPYSSVANKTIGKIFTCSHRILSIPKSCKNRFNSDRPEKKETTNKSQTSFETLKEMLTQSPTLSL